MTVERWKKKFWYFIKWCKTIVAKGNMEMGENKEDRRDLKILVDESIILRNYFSSPLYRLRVVQLFFF